jgi:hypothetical protein
MCDCTVDAEVETIDADVNAEPFTGVPVEMLEGVADCAVVVTVLTRWFDCCNNVRAACKKQMVMFNIHSSDDENTRMFTGESTTWAHLDFPESIVGILID